MLEVIYPNRCQLKVPRGNKQCLKIFVGENFVSDEQKGWNGNPAQKYTSKKDIIINFGGEILLDENKNQIPDTYTMR